MRTAYGYAYGQITPPPSPKHYTQQDDITRYLDPQLQQQAPATPVESASPAPGYCTPESRLGLLVANRFQLKAIAGVGAYGVVYLAQDIRTHMPYAVKALNKVGLDARQRSFQVREIHHHYQASRIQGQPDFHHPNVVSLHKIVETLDCTFVILEYCPEGDLFLNITERQKYFGKDNLVRDVFFQILDSVEHCHRLGIYHRDLKPENILVANDGRTVKLADFGLATTEHHTFDHGCGSQFYMSPECLQPQAMGYDSAPNDIWSLGVILVNLTCGRNPWRKAALDDSTYRGYFNDRNFLQSILPLSPELNFILTRMFEPDPRRRATIPELRELLARCTKLTTTSQEVMPLLHFPGCQPIQEPCGQMLEQQEELYNQVRNSRPVPADCSSTGSSSSSRESVFSAQSTPSSCSSNTSMSDVQMAGVAYGSPCETPLSVVVQKPQEVLPYYPSPQPLPTQTMPASMGMGPGCVVAYNQPTPQHNIKPYHRQSYSEKPSFIQSKYVPKQQSSRCTAERYVSEQLGSYIPALSGLAQCAPFRFPVFGH